MPSVLATSLASNATDANAHERRKRIPIVSPIGFPGGTKSKPENNSIGKKRKSLSLPACSIETRTRPFLSGYY
jgi:hypothetical protein